MHGYAFGDDVLKCIARNLKFFCQEDELCARIEKDTFAVLLHFTDSDAFHNRLHRIREKLLDASIAACLKHPIQYIGGVYLIKDACGESIKSMLDKAVLAMQYVERNSRISDFLYFEDWMLYQKNRSSELLEEAVKAMQEDTFAALHTAANFSSVMKKSYPVKHCPAGSWRMAAVSRRMNLSRFLKSME
ncbi:MAG: diguanylate cyclase domain-containing protein [[Clostridium] innocuum]